MRDVLLVCALLSGCGDNTGGLVDPPDASSLIDGGIDGPPGTPDGATVTDGGNPQITEQGVAQCSCHGCAWAAGRAFCWGDNRFGQLGDDSRDSRAYARPVLGLDNIVQLSVGCGSAASSGHTCAVTTADEVWCWGANADDQIGDESGEDQLLPKKIASLSGVAAVSLGALHTCALLRDGRVFCWGDNGSLQIGDDTATDRPAPTPAKDLVDAVEISMGQFHGCARRQGGALACWGRNAYGEVGTGDQNGVFKPTPVLVIDDAVQIAGGGFHTCARRQSGGAWCWGHGTFGTLGNGTDEFAQLTPVEVDLPWEPVELASGQAVCARNQGGEVSCWSVRFDETLNPVILLSPAPMEPLSPAGGLGGFCAISAQRVVSCWGFNTHGQLGDQTMDPSDVPVEVVGLTW